MPNLPSAEEHKQKLYDLYTDEDGEPCWPETPKLLEWSRAYARDGLEAAAEVADRHRKDGGVTVVIASKIRKLREKM